MGAEPQEPGQQRFFTHGLQSSAFAALFAFCIMEGFAYYWNVHIIEESGFTSLTYLFLNIAVYGFAATSAGKLLDRSSYKVIALSTLLFCGFAVLMNLLAFTNAFPMKFSYDSAERILYPQLFLCMGALVLNVFCSIVDRSSE